MSKFIGLIAAAALLAGCTTAQAPRWRIVVTDAAGAQVGTMLVEPTDEPATGSCVGRTTMKRARVIEKQGFAHDPVRDAIGLEVRDGRFYAELALGVCDANLSVEGPVSGTRASGTAERSTIAGAQSAGTFVAEQVPAAAVTP